MEYSRACKNPNLKPTQERIRRSHLLSTRRSNGTSSLAYGTRAARRCHTKQFTATCNGPHSLREPVFLPGLPLVPPELANRPSSFSISGTTYTSGTAVDQYAARHDLPNLSFYSQNMGCCCKKSVVCKFFSFKYALHRADSPEILGRITRKCAATLRTRIVAWIPEMLHNAWFANWSQTLHEKERERAKAREKTEEKEKGKYIKQQE